jgi:hypothetical protein
MTLAQMTMSSNTTTFLGVLESKALSTIVIEKHKGISLCDMNRDDSDDSAFIARTKEALNLIARKDPRRFGWVQVEIRYIINKELNYLGQYRRRSRSCFIDYGRMQFDDHPEWRVLLYAGLIVHEATHGHLYSKGFFRLFRGKFH